MARTTMHLDADDVLTANALSTSTVRVLAGPDADPFTVVADLLMSWDTAVRLRDALTAALDDPPDATGDPQ